MRYIFSLSLLCIERGDRYVGGALATVPMDYTLHYRKSVIESNDIELDTRTNVTSDRRVIARDAGTFDTRCPFRPLSRLVTQK